MRSLADIFATAKQSVSAVARRPKCLGVGGSTADLLHELRDDDSRCPRPARQSCVRNIHARLSALLFANVIQFALITQPHNVLGSTRQGEDYKLYTTATGGCR